MDTIPILSAPWPHDLEPSDVPFAMRTATILERQGIYDDPIRLSQVTITDVLGWWNAGPAIVDDLRLKGNEAIRRHHTEIGLLEEMEAGLSVVASESRSRRVWRRDPRFARFVPRGNSTVYETATSGSAVDRRFLWEHRNGLRDAVDAQARLSLLDAVAQYVEAISGQHGERLDMLLAHSALNGSDPTTGTEAAGRLGVSHQRFYQIVRQQYRARDRACPSGGMWMPQVDAADENGWPGSISKDGKSAMRGFVKSDGF